MNKMVHSKNCILYLLILFLQQASSQFQLYDITPQNTYVYVKAETTLRCQVKDPTNKQQLWTEYISNNQGAVIARNGVVEPAYRSRFQITADNYLRVISVQPADSGVYSCKREDYTEQDAYYVYLVVITLDPVVTSVPVNTTVPTGTVVTFTCKFSVAGAWVPDVYWIGSKSGQKSVETQFGDSSNTLQITTESKHNQEEFGCVIVYGIPKWEGQRYKDVSSLQYKKLGVASALNIFQLIFGKPNETSDSGKGGTNVGAVVGLVISLLVIAVVIAVCAYLGYDYYREKKKKKNNEEASDGRGHENPGAESTQNGPTLQRLKQSVKNLTTPVYEKFRNLRRRSSASTINSGMPGSDGINMTTIGNDKSSTSIQETSEQQPERNNSRTNKYEATEDYKEIGAAGDLGGSNNYYVNTADKYNSEDLNADYINVDLSGSQEQYDNPVYNLSGSQGQYNNESCS